MPVAVAPPGEGERVSIGRERPWALLGPDLRYGRGRSISEAVMSPPQSVPPGVRPVLRARRRLRCRPTSAGPGAPSARARAQSRRLRYRLRGPPCHWRARKQARRATAPGSGPPCRCALRAGSRSRSTRRPMTIGRRSARRTVDGPPPAARWGVRLDPRPDAAALATGVSCRVPRQPAAPAPTQTHGPRVKAGGALGPPLPHALPDLARRADAAARSMLGTASAPPPGPASVSPRDAGPTFGLDRRL